MLNYPVSASEKTSPIAQARPLVLSRTPVVPAGMTVAQAPVTLQSCQMTESCTGTTRYVVHVRVVSFDAADED